MRRLIGQPAKPGRHPNPEIRRASRSQQQKGRAANARRVLRARLPAHHRDQTCRPGIDHPIAGWLCVHRSSRTTKGAAAPAGRTGPVRSASPRGVGRRARSTGAYADAAAFVAREGLLRHPEAGSPQPDVPGQQEPVQNAKQDLGSAKRRTKSAAQSRRRTKSAAKSPPPPTGRPKPKSKSPSSRPRAVHGETDRTRVRAS